ncbi:hypothetical protein [Psychromonas arctica]|uniref:hypothetical protein n=1 Tax=Psychromonas arctica TaxID=168275 RepID=UPI002FD019A8
MKLYRTLDEVEISGSINELAEIHKSLMSASDNYNETFIFDTSGSSKSYDFLEEKLTILTSPKPACASFDENIGLVVSGNIASLKAFGSFFDFEFDAKTGEHYHWDNACDPEYTSRDTLPIVVSVA